jgi:hypothetical protein
MGWAKEKKLGLKRKKERKENESQGFGPVDFDWPKLKPKPIFPNC